MDVPGCGRVKPVETEDLGEDDLGEDMYATLTLAKEEVEDANSWK